MSAYFTQDCNKYAYPIATGEHATVKTQDLAVKVNVSILDTNKKKKIRFLAV